MNRKMSALSFKEFIKLFGSTHSNGNLARTLFLRYSL